MSKDCRQSSEFQPSISSQGLKNRFRSIITNPNNGPISRGDIELRSGGWFAYVIL